MKYILIIFLLFITLVKSQNTNQLLLIENYIYTGVCSLISNNLESSLSSSSSSSSSDCLDSLQFSKSYVKLQECTIFQMQPALFTYDSNTNEIVQKIYTDLQCKNYVESKYHTIGSCNTTCLYGQGLTFRMYIVDELDIPLATLVSVIYNSKHCNGNYKDSYIEIDLRYLNYCQAYINTDYPSYSVKTICNDTSQTNYIYETSNCQGNPNIEHYPLYNQCGTGGDPTLNFFQFCNN